ncbi:hypothetical protein HPULCUR_006208 [Helicostylum pulchrum]|uniref:AB hydrolase-1 domain-containing protein n=1 Tax=Helicostylum pulchrum TaxID=562976 RepID=A0ABP9Y232_9FUNG
MLKQTVLFHNLTMSEHFLQVDGAKICYEVKGNGPYIVCISGGDGGYKQFIPLRDRLVKHFTVVLYNRRGYSKSILASPQDFSKRVEIDASDLYETMKSLTNTDFSIFASSSSGIVALKYIFTHPDTVRTCFLHEPMIDLFALPEGDYALDFRQEGYEIYNKYGRGAAILHSGKKYFNKLDYYYTVERQLQNMASSGDYHFEHEPSQYLFTEVDMKKANTYKDKMVLIYGLESFNSFVHLPIAEFSKSLEKEMVEFPGGHIGFFTEYEKFAVKFIKLCRDHSLINHPNL